MNESTKTGIVMGLVFLFLLIIPIAMIFKGGEGKDMIAKIEEAMNSSETQVIYIGSKNCSYCELFTPVIKQAAKTNDFEYLYFDIAALTQSQYLKLGKIVSTTGEFGTPHTIITKNGEIIDELPGYVAEAKLLEFLKDNEIIEEAILTPTALNMIDYNEYKSIIAGTERKAVVFASSSCSWCAKAKPILEEIASEEEIEINYFLLDELTQEQYQEIMNTFADFKEGIGTPTTLVLEGTKVIAKQPGYTDKAGYTKFFEDSSIIK